MRTVTIAFNEAEKQVQTLRVSAFIPHTQNSMENIPAKKK
jgi:hypothetical protein